MYWRLAAAVICVATLGNAAVPAVPNSVRSDDVAAVIGADRDAAAAAVARLRAVGPPALEALLARRAALAAAGPPANGDNAALARLDAAIDQVGGQRDCTSSRLYWHTDWNAARAAARESGKPILSLRMLGNLTDDCSCANSRFFRTALYPNAEVSQFLRDHYVLHWKSVRPVPKVTIDFGDGRKLVRTVTGNSIHYVLDADGRVHDGLPGLYGPQEFLSWLRRMNDLHTSLRPLNSAEHFAKLQKYHTTRKLEVLAAWRMDLERVAPQKAAGLSDSRPRMTPVDIVDKTMDDSLWDAVAKLHQADAKLDAASVSLVRRKHISARDAGRLAMSKRRVEDPVLRVVAQFESSIALDTVRNEYLLHAKLHDWFATAAKPLAIEPLNEQVYATLFLTPSSDPWLGLKGDDVFAALDNNGEVTK